MTGLKVILIILAIVLVIPYVVLLYRVIKVVDEIVNKELEEIRNDN